MKTVLAVHPERHVRRLIEVNMEKAGYCVLSAADTEEAMRLVREQKIDMVMMDWMLTDLQAALKNNPTTRDVPIVVLEPNKEAKPEDFR